MVIINTGDIFLVRTLCEHVGGLMSSYLNLVRYLLTITRIAALVGRMPIY